MLQVPNHSRVCKVNYTGATSDTVLAVVKYEMRVQGIYTMNIYT